MYRHWTAETDDDDDDSDEGDRKNLGNDLDMTGLSSRQISR